MKTIIKLILLTVFTTWFSTSYSQIINLIPSDHLDNDAVGVINSWINSGANLIPTQVEAINQIDVTESGFAISPNMEPCGDAIKSLILQYSSLGPVMLYFPAGAYLIDKPIILQGNIILKGAGGDADLPKQTHFHFNLDGDFDHPCITLSNERNGIEDIYIIDDTPDNSSITGIGGKYLEDIGFFSNDDSCISTSNDSKNVKTPDDYYQYTINITGNNNWIRGVESGHTRRFHLNVAGFASHNTVSGSYFHHAVDYSDNDGRGYGVCFSGTAEYNRIEDNIFRYLRHSMVLQGDAERNVLGYNYSREIHATGGNPFYPEADLLLHGRPGDPGSYEHGPKANLMEGNFVERIRVDDQHDEKNGPFNTYFRCTATTWFKISSTIPEFQENQYKQNVVGSVMEPQGNTLKRIKKEGFYTYWVDAPYYWDIPDFCASYYHNVKPDFFGGQSWPLRPWTSQPPSTSRYFDGTSKPLYIGWADYENLCGPPNLKLTNPDEWAGEVAEYKAMKKIIIQDLVLTNDNLVIFHAGEKVILKPGFKVLPDNNHIIFKAGGVCDEYYENSNPQKLYFKNSTLNTYGSKESFNDTHSFTVNKIEQPSIEFNSSILIYPNPSKGRFYIYGVEENSNLLIKDLMGKRLEYEYEVERSIYCIIIKSYYTGLVFVTIENLGKAVTLKVLIQ